MEGELKRTVGDTALTKIRSDIIFGELVPGQRLTLDKLKVRYRIAVTTIREILNRLVAEGLVVAEDNKGFRVAPVTPQNLREIGEMRLLLESHALERSFQNGNLDWEGAVIAAHHKLKVIEAQMVAGEPVDQPTWKRYDWEFHQALIAGCGSEIMLQMHSSAFDHYLRYQILAMSFRGAVAAEEHGALMDCAMLRDVDGARVLLARHVAAGITIALESSMFH